MMEKTKLRQADLITSVFLMLFGLWVLSEGFQMPMQDTYGGVKNVWYVSPALFPLIVGFGVVILGAVLLVGSVRAGAAASLAAALRAYRPGLSESNLRFLGILLAIGSFVYFYIPRVDFVLTIALFLSYFIPAFYYDTQRDLRRLSAVYGAVFLSFLVLYWTGVAAFLNSAFEFSTDVIALSAVVGVNIYARRLAGTDPDRLRRFRVGFAVAIATPLLLAPVFRFLLYVRLPHEGGIVQLMQVIRYSLR